MRILICFTTFLVLHPLRSQSSQGINYTVDDGLPSNMVYCIEQDDRGLMWFGTDSGLSRFDGYEFKSYGLDDGLPDTEILNFFQDSQGRIWLYTLNGKVGFIEGDSIYTSRNLPYLKELDGNSRITSIAEQNNNIFMTDVAGDLRVLVNEGVLLLSGNVVSSYLCSCNGSIYWIRKREIEGDMQSDILQVSYNHETNRIQQGKVKILQNNPLRVGLGYLRCLEDEIIGISISKSSTYLVKINTVSFQASEVSLVGFMVVNNARVGNRLWLFLDDGVYLFDPATNSSAKPLFNIPNPSNYFEDNEGNQWISSLSGGVRFIMQRMIAAPINGTKEINILETAAEKLFFLDPSGYGYFDKDLRPRRVYKSDKALFPNYFRVDPSGNRWVILGENLIKNEKKLMGRIYGMVVTSDDSMVFITAERELYRSSNNHFEPDFLGQLPYFKIRDIQAMSSDSLIIAVDQGLHYYSKRQYKPFDFDELRIRIYEIAFDQDSSMVLSSDGKGILLFDGDEVIEINQQHGLHSMVFTNLLLQDSVIWAASPVGLHKIQKKAMNYSVELITKNDGLLSYDIEDIQFFDGRIFLALQNGLVSFPADRSFKEDNDFQVFLDQVEVDGTPFNGSVIAPESKELSITYKAIRYRNHNNLLYQYQLTNDGDTSAWATSSSNLVNYYGLDPGSYTFRVRAKTKNSEWTVPAEYQFEVEPAYWQTWWFRSSTSLASLGFLFIAFRFYSKTRTKQKRLTQEKLLAEIKALKAQINPHFLFNALNSIQSFVLEDNKVAAETYLVKYAKLVRRILDHSDRLLVPLSEELETIKLYIELEQLRFSQRFDFELNVDENIDLYGTNVPSMILQPFLENAIWHGISKIDHKGLLIVAINQVDDHIEVDIVDNGIGFDTLREKSKSVHGSQLVRERLKLLKEVTGTESTLTVSSEPGYGTRIHMVYQDDFLS